MFFITVSRRFWDLRYLSSIQKCCVKSLRKHSLGPIFKTWRFFEWDSRDDNFEGGVSVIFCFELCAFNMGWKRKLSFSIVTNLFLLSIRTKPRITCLCKWVHVWNIGSLRNIIMLRYGASGIIKVGFSLIIIIKSTIACLRLLMSDISASLSILYCCKSFFKVLICRNAL